MRTILFFMFCLCAVYSASAQIDEDVVRQKEQKIQEKKVKEDAKLKEEAKIKEMLTKRKFVLEADYLSGRTGLRRSVTSSLNFIKLDSANCIVQVGSNSGLGANGVGGVTAEGRVSKYELSTDKKNNHTIKISMSSSLGFFDIVIYVSSSGNADADLRGNYSGSLTFSGKIISLKETRVYKGSSM